MNFRKRRLEEEVLLSLAPRYAWARLVEMGMIFDKDLADFVEVQDFWEQADPTHPWGRDHSCHRSQDSQDLQEHRGEPSPRLGESWQVSWLRGQHIYRLVS